MVCKSSDTCCRPVSQSMLISSFMPHMVTYSSPLPASVPSTTNSLISRLLPTIIWALKQHVTLFYYYTAVLTHVITSILNAANCTLLSVRFQVHNTMLSVWVSINANRRHTSIIAHQNESAILQQSSNSSPQFPTKTKLITEKIAEKYQFFDFSFIKFIND